MDRREFPACLADHRLARRAVLFGVRGARDAVLGVGFPVKIGRELDQVAEALLAIAHHHFGLLAAHELADLARDDRQRLHQSLVGLAGVARGQREHADGKSVGDHRREERAARPALRREQRPRIVLRVGYPESLAALPYRADQARARRDGELARVVHETLDIRGADRPGLLHAHDARIAIQPEVAAAVPAFGFADRPQRALQGGRYVVGFGKHAGDGVLEAQALLGALVLGNVAADAAVALEVSLGVEDRLAADREPAAAAAWRRPLHLEVAEWLVALEARAVRGPVGFAQVRRRLVPAPATEISRGVEPGAMGEERRHEGEPELGVLLPVPVGRKLRQFAETLFAAAERVERARLQCGQAHRALERAVG